MKVQAAVIEKPNVVKMATFPKPTLGPKDMLLKVKMCGICGSDIHIFHGAWAEIPYPIIPGHEFVGEVAEVGDEAARKHKVSVGEKVTVEMFLPCSSCFWCIRGYPNLCEVGPAQFGGTISSAQPPHLWGGWAEYMYVPYEARVHKLPQEVPWEAAVLTEPLAVATRAVHLARIKPGDSAVVVGPGPIGLLSIVAAKTAGANPLILTGTREERLELGKELGADYVINVRKTEVIKMVNDLTAGRGADIVIEAAGTLNGQIESIKMARAGGTVIFVGLTGDKEITFNPDRLVVLKELRIQGSYLSAWAYEPAIKFISNNYQTLEKLVTHKFPLNEVKKALTYCAERRENCIKVVLVPD